MSVIHRWASLCILALFLLFKDTTSQITHLRSFKPIMKCPTVKAKLHQEKLRSQTECGIVCTGDRSCNSFYLDPVTKLCYLGDACSAQTQWTDGICESFQYSEVQPESAKTGIQNPLFEKLQMKLFYKFKSSGIVNEVNPGQYCLAASNVTVDSNGAHFRGNNGSYLSTETPGFEQFLDYGNVYSFYLKVRHATSNNSEIMYHRFGLCSAPLNPGNTFVKGPLNLFSTAFCTKGGWDRVYSQSPDFLTPSEEAIVLSVGYSYNRTAHQHFYSSLNQTLLPAIPDPSKASAGSISASNFQCLRLGYSPLDLRCLNGTMYCYGMSTKILGFEDYKLLDAYCEA